MTATDTDTTVTNTTDAKLRIMIVEDERLVARDLQYQLEDMGHEVVANCDNWDDAVKLAETEAPEFALLDINIRGDKNGVEIARHLHDWIDIPFLFLSAHSDADTLRQAGMTGPSGYLVKPVNEKDLRAGIQVALHRHRAEKERTAMQKWLAATVQSLGDAVVSVERDGRIKHINPMAEALLEVSRAAAVCQPVRRLLNITDAEGARVDPVATALAGETLMALNDNHVLMTPAGVERPVTFSASPVRDPLDEIDGAVVVLRERRPEDSEGDSERLLTERLAQARRLETIGSIARGVAHDFNNLFAAMSGNADIALEELSEPQPALNELNESLVEIRQAINKGAELCRRIVTSGGVAPIQMLEIGLTELVSDSLPGMQASLNPKVELRIKTDGPTDLFLPADPLALRNALQLLVDNAAEAYGDKEGVIEISVSEATLDATELSSLAGGAKLEPGRFALMTVADQGCGIPSHAMPRVFDPFFTTRFVGRGLGLAQVLGIAHSHQGGVKLESKEGQGTTISLALPCA